MKMYVRQESFLITSKTQSIFRHWSFTVPRLKTILYCRLGDNISHLQWINLSINLMPILGGASFTKIYCLFMGSGNAKQDLTFFFYAAWFFNELSVNLENLWDLCAGCYGCCLPIGCCFYKKAHVCPCSNGVQSSQMEGVCILLILVEARFIKYFYYPR